MSREIERFDEAFKVDTQAAGIEYGMNDRLQQLLGIAEILRQKQMETEELASGAELGLILKKNGIDENQAKSFSSSVLKLGKDQGFDAKRLIEACRELTHLELYGNYGEIKPEWESIGKQLPGKRVELSGLETAISKKTKEQRELGIKDQELQDFISARDKLRSYGLDVKNYVETANVITNIKDSDFKPGEIVSILKKHKNLELRTKQLQIDIEKSQTEHTKIKEESKLLELGNKDLVSKSEEMRRTIQKLEDQAKTAKGQTDEALKNSHTTMAQLEDFVKARAYFVLIGCNIDDLPKLRNVLSNAAEDHYDSKKILEKLSRFESVSEEIANLEEKLEKGKREDSSLAIKLETEEEKLKVLRASVSELETTQKKMSDNYIETMSKTLIKLKNLGDKSVSDITSQLQSASESIGQAAPKIQEFSEKIKEAEKAADEIATYGKIGPLYELIKDGKGSEVEVCTFVSEIVNGFKKWSMSEGLNEAEVSNAVQTLISWTGEHVRKVGK